MTDQAAGLRAWAAPDGLPLGVIGEPDEGALRQVLASIPAPAGLRWQARLGEEATRETVAAWVLWVDTAEVDVADLYRRVKRALVPAPSTAASQVDSPMAATMASDTSRGADTATELLSVAGRNTTSTPLLLLLHDAGRVSPPPPLSSATVRLLTNLGAALKRFLNVELTRDVTCWQRGLDGARPMSSSQDRRSRNG